MINTTTTSIRRIQSAENIHPMKAVCWKPACAFLEYHMKEAQLGRG